MSLINGAQSCNVFFRVGSSATLGTGTDFVGTIMALTSITVTTGTKIEGRALARNGAVTLDSNDITPAACEATKLGTAPLEDGTASLTLAMPAFGSNTVTATATVTDAVGPVSGYHLGTGLRALAGAPVIEHAWVRAEAAGRAVDSRNNEADFRLVSTTGGMVGGVQSMLGSASPTGRTDPYQHNAQLPSYLLDPTVSAGSAPNRVSSPGKLVVRRTITNTSSVSILEAKIRVTALSEANGSPRPGGSRPASRADLRVVDPTTSVEVVTLPGGGTRAVRNLSPDAPSVELGGGMNTTLSLPLAGGLAPGESIAVAFTFDVDTRGTFWFGYNVDAADRVIGNRDDRAGTSKIAIQRNQERLSNKVVVPADSGRAAV